MGEKPSYKALLFTIHTVKKNGNGIATSSNTYPFILILIMVLIRNKQQE